MAEYYSSEALLCGFYAGMIGGPAGWYVSHPLDTVKSRQQSQENSGYMKKHRNGIRTFQAILKTEGVRGLYKGVIPPMLAQVPVSSIVFGVEYMVAKKFGGLVENKLLKHSSTGAIAGFVQSFICGPCELIKLHTQHQGIGVNVKYDGNIAALRKIYLQGGIRGCFRGLGSTIIRDVPGYAVFFGTYEGLVDWTAKKTCTERETVPYVYRFMIGGFAGANSWMFNYPFDLVKTQIQLDGVGNNRCYKNTFDCLKKTFKRGGLPLLYQGFWFCAMRAAVCDSVTFCVSDLIKENCWR